jgi:hypothetical protein
MASLSVLPVFGPLSNSRKLREEKCTETRRRN